MESFNGVKLTGDVAELNKAGFKIICKNTAASGNEFTEEISVILPKKSQPSWLENGKKVNIKGTLASGNIQKIKVLKLTEADKNA